MKRQIVFFSLFLVVFESWAVSKPMEAAPNYNVMMVHGAYGLDKGIENCSPDYAVEAATAKEYLSTSGDAANIGYYNDEGRLTYWLDSLIFEDYAYDSNGNPYVGDLHKKSSPCIYSWRAFVNPANSSINNAHELGDRKWNQKNLSFGNGGFGHRRTLMEEAQEVKAIFHNLSTNRNDSGQAALDSIRKNPDLYRQLASRYVLIGHSMGGVVSREWIQNSNFYHGEVDKVITLDSPHEGTGALNMELGLLLFCSKKRRKSFKENRV